MNQSNEDLFVLHNPERSEWYCELFGTGSMMTLHPEKGREPNFFWRWMQYLCFGNRWKRI